jgi:hypothetical protein
MAHSMPVRSNHSQLCYPFEDISKHKAGLTRKSNHDNTNNITITEASGEGYACVVLDTRLTYSVTHRFKTLLRPCLYTRA